MDIGAELQAKMGPFPTWVWLGGVTALGGVYYLVKGGKKKAATTGTPGTACTQSDGSAGTWDSTGTVCQASTVSTVNEPTSGSTQGSTGTGATRNWRVQSGGSTVTSPPATGTSTTTGSVGATVPPPATTITNAPPGNTSGGPITSTVTGLHTTSVGSTTATLAWNPLTVPAGQGPLRSYMVQVYNSSGDSVYGPVSAGMSTSATVSGLKAKTAYHANVWADPASQGGPHATVPFTTT
jgi:hypothetical protein